VVAAAQAAAVLSIPATAIAWGVRGPSGAIAASAAIAIVAINLVLAASLLVVASKRSPSFYPNVAMPSYALRMAGVFASMSILRHQSFVDWPTFTIVFTLGVAILLAYEGYIWSKTPWLATVFWRQP